MADPLTLLKDFNLRKELDQVHIKDGRVNFGDSYSFDRNAYVPIKNTRDNDLYSLEAALFLLQKRAMPQAEYIKLASVNRLSRPVTILDRKRLLEYLDGIGELQLEVLPDYPHAGPSAAGDDGLEPALKRARHSEHEDSAMTRLLAQERQLRTRNTMLLAPNRDFKKVLDIMQAAQESRARELRSSSKPAALHKSAVATVPRPPRPSSGPPQQAGGLPMKASGRLDRDDTRSQLAAMAGGAGNIDINLYGYQKSAGNLPPPPPPPPPSHSGRPHSSQQAPPLPPSTSGRPPPPPSSRPSSGAHASTSGQRPPHGAPQQQHGGAAPPGGAAKKGGIPIIIVPSGMTAMVNMYNAKQFLEDGQFEGAGAAKDRGVQKVPVLVIHRTVGRTKPVPYHIMEKVPDKASPDWDRVVAVVAQGVKWQFKDFKFKGAPEGDLTETFHRVCGFYFHWTDDQKPCEALASGNVRRMAIHRENRHFDSTVLRTLYAHLDTFISARKSTLGNLAY